MTNEQMKLMTGPSIKILTNTGSVKLALINELQHAYVNDPWCKKVMIGRVSLALAYDLHDVIRDILAFEGPTAIPGDETPKYTISLHGKIGRWMKTHFPKEHVIWDFYVYPLTKKGT